MGFLITAVVIVWHSSGSGRVGVNRVFRSQTPIAHEEAVRIAHDAFDVVATQAYEAIGSPRVPPHLNMFLTGWDIFSTIVGIIKAASTLT